MNASLLERTSITRGRNRLCTQGVFVLKLTADCCPLTTIIHFELIARVFCTECNSLPFSSKN